MVERPSIETQHFSYLVLNATRVDLHDHHVYNFINNIFQARCPSVRPERLKLNNRDLVKLEKDKRNMNEGIENRIR